MKKIIFIFLLLFIFMTNSKALTESFSLGEKVPNMIIESHKNGDTHNGKIFIITRKDGQYVYCLNPFKKLNTVNSYKGYYYNDSRFNLSEENLNKINSISYYGYKYKDHDDLKWYGITQLLIWRTLGIDSYFVDDDGNRINNYDNEINELQSLVDTNYNYPSFFNNNFKFTVNSSNKIIDVYNVLDTFKIVKSDIEASINGDELLINTKDEGEYTIEFEKYNKNGRNYILYNLNDNQDLIYPSDPINNSFSITVEVYNGTVTVNKIDSESADRVEAKLEGAIYGLYDEFELVTTIETNKDGVGFIDNLPLGKYYIKELSPSLGYYLDENIYEFEITKDTQDIYINSYENVIKANVIINKYYGYDDNYEFEDGALFEIYDINDNLVGTYETVNGVINVLLEYGSYRIKQVRGLYGYELVKDFIVNIDENKDYVYNLYDKSKKINSVEDLILTNKDDIDYNKKDLIVEVPNTSKNDYDNLFYLLFIFVGGILIFISKIKKIDV